MREIKFRSWVEHEDKVSGKNNYSYMNENPEFHGSINEVFATSGKEPLNPYGNTITYMQFTGLKDKNGVEIYEGDVLAYCIEEYPGGHYLEREEKREVTFSVGCYWLISDKGDDPLYAVHASDDEIEVIGNIYENPELLEVQS